MFKSVLFAVIIGVAVARPGGEGDAQIKSYGSDASPDGSYQYAFETTNGISQQEQGVGGQHAQGASSYVSPEGVPIQLSYTADENGFHPQGSHVPPVPDYIVRALEWIAAHPYKGDDYVTIQQQQKY